MPRTQTKTTKQTVPLSTLQLPDHIHMNDRELSCAIRLTRVLRERGFWLGHFIEEILKADAESATQLPIDGVQEILKHLDTLMCMEKAVASLKKMIPDGLHRSVDPRTVAPPAEVIPESEEDQFYQLVKMWRQEHPKPEVKRRNPAGHLGRETEEAD